MRKKIKTRPIIIILFWCLALLSFVAGHPKTFVMNISTSGVLILNLLFMFMAVVLLLALALQRKKLKLGLTFIVILFLGIFVLFSYWFNPYRNSLKYTSVSGILPGEMHITNRQAEEDLHQMYRLLKRIHPVFLRNEPNATRVTYNNVLDILKGSPTLSIYEFRRLAQSVLSTLNDAHTTTYQHVYEYHYLPDHEEMKQNGYSLHAINGQTLEKIFEENSNLYSFEAESWGKENFKHDIVSLEGLSFLGFDAHAGIVVTYLRDNVDLSQVYYSSDFLSFEKYAEKYGELLEKRPEKFVSFELNQGQDYALLTLLSCDYNEEYKTTVGRMFSGIKQRKIKNVIVDLRNNGGGNSMVANEFIKYLDIDMLQTGYSIRRWGPMKHSTKGNPVENNKREELLYSGNVFVLTSPNTFSSAMMFAWHIQDNGLGFIVGETPGNTANGYGDVTRHILDNSRLILQLSTKEFKRADSSRGDYIIPDLECSADDALNQVLQHIEEIKAI